MGALSGAVGTYAATGPSSRRRVLGAARARARGRLHPGGGARPPRRAAVGDRARGRRARALRHRDPPPAAHRGARGRGAVPRRPEGLVGDAAQAQPDRLRADHRARAASCAATRRPASRTSRCGTSATSRTPRSSASSLPDATILLDYVQHLAIRVVDGMAVDPDRMLANLELTHGALFSPAGAAGARGVRRARATTPTAIVQEHAQRAWDEGVAFRDLLGRTRARLGWTWTRSSTPSAFVRTPTRSSRRLDESDSRRVGAVAL